MHAVAANSYIVDAADATETAALEQRARWRDRARRFGILCAVWAVPGLVGGFSLGELAGGPQEASPVSLGRALVWQLIAWIAWAPWTALVIWLVRKMPFRREGWWKPILVHIGVCAVAASAQMLLAVLLDRTFWPGGVSSPVSEHIRSAFLRLSDFEVVTYMAVLTAGVALDYFRRYRDEQLSATRLQTEFVKAQLLALRSQLNPHFLFNALNSVISLMDRDVPAAQRMVARLGELLRLSLGTDEAMVPLARELSLVMQYLEIERIRFGDRLTVTVDVPADLLDIDVPNLVLQPLVENAIVHGVGPRPGPGRVTVQAHRLGTTLILRVLDDGVGLSRNGTPSGHGIGVGNTRARLHAMYGDDASLTLRQADWGGAVAEVRLPLEVLAAV